MAMFLGLEPIEAPVKPVLLILILLMKIEPCIDGITLLFFEPTEPPTFLSIYSNKLINDLQSWFAVPPLLYSSMKLVVSLNP
jgi:hypothetical protein